MAFSLRSDLRRAANLVVGLAEQAATRVLNTRFEAEIVAGLQGLPVRPAVRQELEKLKPAEAWHSWDLRPWEHPWLTRDNLQAVSLFQMNLLARLEREVSEGAARAPHYGFVGNLANNMTMRAVPLRRQGYDIDIVLHPHDRYVMSQPGWELSDAVLTDGETDVERLRQAGLSLPAFDGVIETTAASDVQVFVQSARMLPARKWKASHPAAHYLRQRDALLWPEYMGFLPVFEALQGYDALLAAQAPYLAYLSGRPYLAAQTGGDLWFEAARDDAFGRLQRLSYAKASAILASNPWAFAHARRYGFNHVLYIPLLIDTDRYRPGTSSVRAAWQAEFGGDFFVLATTRLDRMWKGSEIGLEGFQRFAAVHPDSRLVVLGWGEHKNELLSELNRRGLAGRVVSLPISGKRKLIEYLRAADCVLDQFKIGYYGATALEAMACGVPVIMRLLTQQYEALCPTGAPPVLNAATADEVAAALQRLVSSGHVRQEIGERSRRWIEHNHSAAIWGRHYGCLLYTVANRRTLDFTSSPLTEPLAAEELAYHSDCLAAAPRFPQYVI